MSKRSVETGTADVVRDVEDVLDNVAYREEFRQFNRKNNILVAHLYALYRQGHSLGYIAKVLYGGRFSRQSLYGTFMARGYKLRPKKLRPARVYKGMNFRPDHCGLYRFRAGGITTYLHRLIWEEAHGKVPPDHVVIFNDGNKENIVIENL
jgi:hypothetical protein